MARVKVFADRYPFLGPIIWVSTVQYFIVQFIAAQAWRNPPYSWRSNTISDLGNTACGSITGRLVCSPLHGLMNTSFIGLGLLMAGGSLLICQEFRERRASLAGFSLMALAGLGTILVGVFPENTVPALHILGASLPFIGGNLSLIILGVSLANIGRVARLYTLLPGVIALIALALFVTHHYLGLGIGGMERVVAYPQTVWLILFGLYMSRSHYLRRSAARG